ncbi:hypothetical protein G7Y79_00008g024830 [Physcia stellaris]|nr:hypothetical protein G7Y79_00008g024830 [Physcia stellaris]
MEHGNDLDAIQFVAADLAEKGSVLCFDEFQCTDVADAMILRSLLEALMSHGVVLVTTSNRHPDDLYKNGIQRASFIPCINLLKTRLRILNLDSTTDYRKIPRPPSGVYHHPLDKAAVSHADRWFRFFGDPENDPAHVAKHRVWGREIEVPKASGKAAMFTFRELIGRATGAADYLELMRSYDAFIVTDVPGMTHKSRDWARRFITFIDAIYESRAKLVLTTEVPLFQLFMSASEVDEALEDGRKKGTVQQAEEHEGVDDVMRQMMDDLGMNMKMLKNSSLFSGDEERFAFSRALSRLSEMGSQDWVERGMGLEHKGGLNEKEGWQRVRSRWREDSLPCMITVHDMTRLCIVQHTEEHSRPLEKLDVCPQHRTELTQSLFLIGIRVLDQAIRGGSKVPRLWGVSAVCLAFGFRGFKLSEQPGLAAASVDDQLEDHPGQPQAFVICTP